MEIYTKCSVNGQRQSGTLNYAILTMWEMKAKMTPQKTSKLSMELEQVTRSENPAR